MDANASFTSNAAANLNEKIEIYDSMTPRSARKSLDFMPIRESQGISSAADPRRQQPEQYIND